MVANPKGDSLSMLDRDPWKNIFYLDPSLESWSNKIILDHQTDSDRYKAFRNIFITENIHQFTVSIVLNPNFKNTF